MLEFVTKVLGKRTIRLYLNPDINKYQKKSEIKNYIKSIGLSERDWYNDRFLPKDELGNPIVPLCKKSGCSNPCKFIDFINGYYCACNTSHGKSYQSSLEYSIERYGEEEGKKKV